MLHPFDDRHRSNDFNTENISTGSEIKADV
jgi:hypothetical protein